MRKLVAAGLFAVLLCSGCEQKTKTTESSAPPRRMMKPGDQPGQPVPPKT